MSRFGPLTADHPLVGTECPACHQPLKEGQVPAMVTLGPGDDEEARERRDSGRAYNAIATVIHYDCAATEYRS